MKAVISFVVGIMMDVLVIKPGYAGDAGRSHSVHTLRCGASTFLISTDRKNFFVSKQKMSMWTADQRPLVIDLTSHTIRQYDDGIVTDGLSGIVEEWACRNIQHHQFLELLYACNQDMSNADMDRYCPATREWTSYVALDGSVLDRGYQPDDPRYEALEERLGLPASDGPKPTLEVMTPVD